MSNMYYMHFVHEQTNFKRSKFTDKNMFNYLLKINYSFNQNQEIIISE